MIELLAAAACAIAIDAQQDGSLLLRPACPAPFGATRQAVGEALARGAAREALTLDFGRLAQYPWLSTLLARQASSSRQWGSGVEANDYVRRALLGMPEFTALVDPPWRIERLAVSDVRLNAARELDLPQGHPLPPGTLLPYDARVMLRVAR